MCEESVILDALQGKVIPRDAIAAAKYIPVNTRLSPEQKAERCRNCVIYNEHQRQKYQLLLPVAITFVAALYLGLHKQLLSGTHRALTDIDSAVSRFAFASNTTESTELVKSTPGFIEEVMLILVMLFVLSQIVRMIEFAVFKLKV